jgi:hypothetical protein
MQSVSNVHSKQRAVIEFLLAENESITNIHRRLTNVYGDMAVDKSTVDLHYQNKDRAMCLISRAQVAHQQLWRLQQADIHIGNQLGRLCGNWRSVSGGFVPIRMWQKCFFSTTMRGHTHKSAYPRGHHKASVDCPASSTLQPRSDSFQLPSFHTFQRCNPWKEVWGWRGSHFRSKEVVATETYRVVLRRALTFRWPKAIDLEGDYVEKQV